MIIEQKANGARLEAHQWDGTTKGLSGICGKFELAAVSLDSSRQAFSLRESGSTVGDVVGFDWVVKNPKTQEIKIYSNEEFEELFMGRGWKHY